MTVKTGSYHILVIEDNLGDYTLIEESLSDQLEIFTPFRAKNFIEAKETLTSGLFKFDAILLDLSLPDKMGTLLITEIVEMSDNIPVIVLTGYTDFTFGVKSLSLGVSDYLLKDDLTPELLYKSIIYGMQRSKHLLALEESEKQYSALFHLSPQPMWVVGLTMFEFLDVNLATIKQYGYSREEFLTMNLRDIRPVWEIPNLLSSIEADKKHPGIFDDKVMIHQLKSGELRHVEIKIAPIIYKGNMANVVTATDITERIDYINAIEAQNEKLKEISWIQSHVVRSPVARIMGLIPLINDAQENASELKVMLDYLSISANELDAVIKEISKKTCLNEESLSENQTPSFGLKIA